MKNLFFLAACSALLMSCEYVWMEPIHDHVVNPELAVKFLYDGFEMESVTKEDIDYDGNMDYTIYGYDEDDNWIEAIFINNDNIWSTYSFMTGDEFWGDYEYYDDEYSEFYDSVEEYFIDMEDLSTIAETFYYDVDGDGTEDAVVIANYVSEDYESIDVYIFTKSEEGYYYYGIAEVHYPNNSGDYAAFKNVVFKDEYFTVELREDDPYWERFITFKYDDNEGEFFLHKDGGTVKDQEGNLTREEVLTEDDFGTKYFYEFYADDIELFSIKKEVMVTTTQEFLDALSNNTTIYVEPGEYRLNDIYGLSTEIQEYYKDAEDWDDFYIHDYYFLTCGSKDYESDISLTISELQNVDIIGRGDVDFVVGDEMVTVLTFEGCNKVKMEGIYMVHDVGGDCGSNVVDLNFCKDLAFTDCVFDGSGQLAIYAVDCYSLLFTECSFTNCTDGALDFVDSDGMFDNCEFSDNEIWHSLVTADGYSSLDFYECTFSNNSYYIEDHDDSDDTYLFEARNDAYIYVGDYCEFSNNEVDVLANDFDYVILSDSEDY